jgi:hypothetical protein
MNVVETLTNVPASIADLDGRPGDEIVLDVPQYGLVALGLHAPVARRSPGSE